MSGRLYSPQHIWVRVSDDGTALLGVTAQLVRRQKKPVCLNLCDPGDVLRPGDWMGDVEFFKGVFDLRCPVSGVVQDVNEQAICAPRLLQDEPEPWLVRLCNVQTPRPLLDTAAYLRLLIRERNEI